MKGRNQHTKHVLVSIKLHGKWIQVLQPLYKEKQKNNNKPLYLLK